MLLRGLAVLVVALCTATGESVNDTLPVNATALRLGEETPADGSIQFVSETPQDAVASSEEWLLRVDRAVSRRLAQLMLHLQGALRQRTDDADTLLFSPLSISGAMNLLWLGARGHTASELAAFLDGGRHDALRIDEVLPSIRRLTRQLQVGSGGTKVNVANGLFLQYGYPVRTWFANVSQEVFGTEVYGVEFASNGEAVASQINGWVSKKTEGRISKFLHSPLPVSTKVLIANAIYFNGAWENPFPLETTMMRSYTIPKPDGGDPEILTLPMMINSGELPYARSKDLNCHVVGLHYKGKQVTMYLVLPIEKTWEAFRTLEKQLTVENMEKLQEDMTETPVIISVPRMRITSTFHLKETVEKLGVKALFDPVEADLGLMSPGKHILSETVSLESSADQNSSSNGSVVDFPGKTKREAVVPDDNPGLFVDDMIHKVEIEVTETGTVASAVTAVTVTRDGSRIVLRFDRPFLFFIRHESTGLQLFWGSVVRPVT